MKKIRLSGEIGWSVYPKALLQQMPINGEDVEIELYSSGGYIDDGMEIYNILADYSGHVKITCGSLVASSATFIAMAADTLVVRENTRFMIHEPWTITLGNAKDFEHQASLMRDIIDIMAVLYSRKSGKSEADIKAALAEETWLVGQEIVDYGLAHELLPLKGEEAMIESLKDAQAKVGAIKAKMESGESRPFQEGRLAASVMHCAAGSFKRSASEAGDMQPQNKIENQTVQAAVPELKKESFMTFEEFKAQHPALYQQARQEGHVQGVAEERDRVEALMVFSDDDLGKVKNCISEGRDLSKKEFAEIQAKKMNQQALGDLNADSQDNEGKPAEVQNSTALSPDAQAWTNQWKKRLGGAK